eukprot:CAMPEP_0116060280 /NCGR_PEP_ID=MMETSP0322-20121206/6315_1 /TAXON_ID=163516 /ORGANISM="Leptocylindrus danicus var. apora, Strain B651" /LENGTH=358 /DNA_ID=CAMNT_0003544857 /DNA_START=63 /DNA_END=1136 /DNA_ORIENTATION=-
MMEGGCFSSDRYYRQSLAATIDSKNSVLTDEAEMQQHYGIPVRVNLIVGVEKEENFSSELLFECLVENVITREKEMENLAREYDLASVWSGSTVHRAVIKSIQDCKDQGIDVPDIIVVNLSASKPAKRRALIDQGQCMGNYYRFKPVHEPSFFDETAACTPFPTCSSAFAASEENSGVSLAKFDSSSTSNADSLILCLEYLQIIYSPQQLEFENFSSYQRFKLWSDYLSLRVTLARWVHTQMVLSPTKQIHSFLIPDENGVYSSMNVAHTRFSIEGEEAIIATFFNGRDDPTCNLIIPIQEDFVLFLAENVGLTAKFDSVPQKTLLHVSIQKKSGYIAEEDAYSVTSEITHEDKKHGW